MDSIEKTDNSTLAKNDKTAFLVYIGGIFFCLNAYLFVSYPIESLDHHQYLFFLFSIPACVFWLRLTSVPEQLCKKYIRVVLILVLIQGALFLFLDPAGPDLYHHVLDGKMIIAHPEYNSYEYGRYIFKGDNFYKNIVWDNAPPKYGPLWKLTSAIPYLIFGENHTRNLLCMKLICFIFFIGNVFIVYKTSAIWIPKRQMLNTMLVLCNPMLIYWSAGDGRHDMVFTFFVLLGIYGLAKKSPGYAIIGTTMSILIKYISLLLLPFLLAALILDRGRISAAKVNDCVAPILASVALTWAVSYPFGGVWNIISSLAKSLGGLRTFSQEAFWLKLLDFPLLLFPWPSTASGIGLFEKIAGGLASFGNYAFIAVYAVIFVFLGGKVDRQNVCMKFFFAVLLYLNFVGFWIMGWYYSWLFVLIPFLLSPRHTNILVLSYCVHSLCTIFSNEKLFESKTTMIMVLAVLSLIAVVFTLVAFFKEINWHAWHQWQCVFKAQDKKTR